MFLFLHFDAFPGEISLCFPYISRKIKYAFDTSAREFTVWFFFIHLVCQVTLWFTTLDEKFYSVFGHTRLCFNCFYSAFWIVLYTCVSILLACVFPL
jgi:hypothetical protein